VNNLFSVILYEVRSRENLDGEERREKKSGKFFFLFFSEKAVVENYFKESTYTPLKNPFIWA